MSDARAKVRVILNEVDGAGEWDRVVIDSMTDEELTTTLKAVRTALSNQIDIALSKRVRS